MSRPRREVLAADVVGAPVTKTGALMRLAATSIDYIDASETHLVTMIYPYPLSLRADLLCYVELVPSDEQTTLKELVADPSRPLESIRLHFYLCGTELRTIEWAELFVPRQLATLAQLDRALSTCYRLADGYDLNHDAILAIELYAEGVAMHHGYPSAQRYIAAA